MLFRYALLFELEHGLKHLLHIRRRHFADRFSESQRYGSPARSIGRRLLPVVGRPHPADADLDVIFPGTLGPSPAVDLKNDRIALDIDVRDLNQVPNAPGRT